MSDEFETAKAITRAAWPTYARLSALTGPKPICQFCYVTCDWKSRAYRALHACPDCYDDYALQTLTVKKKEKA